jgi:hypothetical protein
MRLKKFKYYFVLYIVPYNLISVASILVLFSFCIIREYLRVPEHFFMRIPLIKYNMPAIRIRFLYPTIELLLIETNRRRLTLTSRCKPSLTILSNFFVRTVLSLPSLYSK